MTVLLFAVAFCVVQRLTFTLRFAPFNRTTIWTPAHLFFALLLAPPRRWWAMVVGLCLGVFAGYYEEQTVPVATAMLSIPSFCVAVGLGAWGVRRFGPNPLFGNLNSLIVFVLTALFVAPVLTQAPEDLIHYLAGADNIWSVSLEEMLCMALGTLIATPALTLTLANGRAWLSGISWRKFIEITALGAALLAVGHLSFGRHSIDESIPAVLLCTLPLLLWAAVRFELAGVSWALLIIAFLSEVKKWLATARHPRCKRPYTELTYQPMLEVLKYLRANGYRTYIVTGGGQDFVRVYAEQVYGIPPEQVVGTAGGDEVRLRQGRPADADQGAQAAAQRRQRRQARGHPSDDRPPAVRGVRQLDRRPADAGVHQAGDGARLGMLVLHDDAKREYAYGPAKGLPDTKVGTFPRPCTTRRRSTAGPSSA